MVIPPNNAVCFMLKSVHYAVHYMHCSSSHCAVCAILHIAPFCTLCSTSCTRLQSEVICIPHAAVCFTYPTLLHIVNCAIIQSLHCVFTYSTLYKICSTLFHLVHTTPCCTLCCTLHTVCSIIHTALLYSCILNSML